MFKITVFIPKNAAEKVKQAMFAAGAGRQGEYDQCCFETEGTGQFRPLQGARPAIGAVGGLERVPELRVEMLCSRDKAKSVIAAMRAGHPYEEPAFDVIPLLAENELL